MSLPGHSRPGRASSKSGHVRARNLIERFFNKIKQCRRVATRYDKLAANYSGVHQARINPHLAAR
jgi:transposase